MRSTYIRGFIAAARAAFCAGAALLWVAGAAHAQDFTVRILSVECVETTAGIGRDDVYLEFNNGRRVPSRSGDSIKMDAGDVWNPQVRVNASGSLQVSVMELDEIVSDDTIGSFVIDVDQDEGEYTEELNGHGSDYEVTYRLSYR